MKIGDIYPSGSQDLGLFGIDSRVEEVESLLCIKSVNEVRMIGIWGVGGIGKTTLANEVSHKIMNNFDGHCFISNVRERLSKKQGLKDLRSKILHEILGYKDIKIYSPCSDDFIRRKLKYMKVLLVLDDVLTYVQLKSILKECGLYSPESFGSGSRIIVTYRDWRMLENVKMKNDIYEVLPLKDNEALQVFNWHAFGRNNPQGEIVQLSKKAVKYAHGVPLALVVLGSELKSKPKRYQENALSKFKTSTRLEIHKMLRICFDGLRGDEVKIFLDIACFLKGEERDCVENFLEASGFHASNGINRLIEKYLITEEEGRISMHDLLQQMGQEIVFEEKQRQRHQSRLWTYKDVREAFTNIRGTENVEAISLRLDENVFTINISPESFIDMNKLRFLQIHHKVHCPLDLGYLPNTIRYLDWRYYPLSHLPCNFNPQMLVELHLHESQLQQLVWNQSLENLRRIDLRGSGSLIKISNLDMAYNLEVILLIDCKSLVEIGFSIKNLKLAELYLHGPQFEELIWNKPLEYLKRIFLRENYSLIRIPDLFRAPNLEVIVIHCCIRLVEIGSIKTLKKLTQLDIRGCASLSHISEIPRSIKELELSNSGIRQIPRTIGYLTHLRKLSFQHCKSLESLPNSICNLISLEKLNLSKCWSLKKLPYNFGNLEALEELDASSSGLRELPFSIQNLKNLKILNLSGCKDLEFVPTLSPNLQVVTDSSLHSRRSIGSWLFGH